MKILTKLCIVCGKEFIKPKSCGLPEWKTRRKFCSKECSDKGKVGKATWNKGIKTGIIPKTAFKKGEFKYPKTAFKKGQSPWNKDKPMEQELYEKLKDSGFFNPKYGEKSGNWRGGITKLGAWIRSLSIYKQWRTSVFQRDNYTCQHCGARSQKGKKVIIHADHIKPFYKILEENRITTVEQAKECKELWDIENGRTLCIPCHKQTPSYLVNQWTK